MTLVRHDTGPRTGGTGTIVHRGPDKVKRIRRNWTVEEPPARIVEFVTWYVWLRVSGETAKAYGLEHDTSEQTINRWMRDPRVVTLIETGLQASNAGPEKVQAILERLHRDAVEGSIGAARLYLETVDRLAPRRVEVTVRDARDLTTEQLRAELRRAAKALDEQARGDRADDQEILDAEVLEDTEPPLDVEIMEDVPSRLSATSQEDSDGGHEEEGSPGVRQGVQPDLPQAGSLGQEG